MAICQVAGKPLQKGDLERFWSKVQRGAPEACWLWSASKIGTHGYKYGQFTLNRGGTQRHIYAHRFAYEVTFGPIADGFKVCHTCDVTACCNPAHLFAGTQGDNLRDASGKGHFKVPRPAAHKINSDQLAEIDALLATGERGIQSRIAERFGVTRTWVSHYKLGRRRLHDRPQPMAKASAA